MKNVINYTNKVFHSSRESLQSQNSGKFLPYLMKNEFD